MCLAFSACICISSHCFLKIKETWHDSFSPDNVLPVSLSSLSVASLSFGLPVMQFTFPVAEKQELQDMHHEILLLENSMEKSQ